MSLGDHLRELRNRVIVCLVAVVVTAIVGWVEYPAILAFLRRPLTELAHEPGWHLTSLNFQSLTSGFAIQLQIALWVGVILASPVWLYELWAFVVPGLTRTERSRALLFIGAAVPLFLAGCALANYTLPTAIHVLVGFTPNASDTSNLIPADEYISFVTRFILAFGLAFLVPVFLVGLNAAGVLPARIMLKGWRIAVIGCFVFAAVMTPTPDPWSMVVMAVPLCGLYFGAWAVSWLLDRRREKQRPDWVDTADDEASAL